MRESRAPDSRGTSELDKKPHTVVIPQPAHPEKRAEPLPWCKPKPPTEDAGSARMLAAILASGSYVPAIRDPGFLAGPANRGVRLQLDYLKPERLLQEQGIDNAIVVFGSSRIVEPNAARTRVEELRALVNAKPDNPDTRAKLARAERIEVKAKFYDIAREFSRLVAKAPDSTGLSRLVVVTGGGPGIMEAANRGAHDGQAKTVGLNITLPHEQYPNPYITPELCFQFHYFAIRKLHFLLRAKALVAFPGGFGTLDEVFETLTLIQTRKIKPVPVVLVGEAYWRRLIDVDFMVEEGVIDAEDRELFWYAETAEEIWQGLKLWYERAEKH